MRITSCFIVFLVTMMIFGGCVSSRYKSTSHHSVFFVSPEGNDAWSGTLAQSNRAKTDGPFATLERARDAIRELNGNRSRLSRNDYVYLRGGTYERTQTFELTEKDTGFYRPYKNEVVRVVGGKEIDGFQPLSAIPSSSRHPALAMLDPATLGNIVYVNLKEQGITDFGELTPRGFGRNSHSAALELFYQDRPMTLAGWPNGEWTRIAETPAGSEGGCFTIHEPRAERWQWDTDIWTHGYWTYDWADSYVKVKSIDPSEKKIVTEEPHGIYGYKKDQRFRVLNLLSELDSPGEWYLDRESGILYFWPPVPIEQEKPIISMLNTPLVTIKKGSWISFMGTFRKPNFHFECSRADGIVIEGATDIQIGGCVLRNLGNYGVVINGGQSNSVFGCEIQYTGDGGISITGGDRRTLAKGHHRAGNNHIHDFSRWCRTYNPAISLTGVGNRISHNHIHDAPHAGIIFWGNDNVIEYNEIHDICKDTGDVGAIYIGRDWTMRGNIIRYNFIHHLLGPYTFGAMAIYLDDLASGTTIFGNVFYKASHAVFIGGGRDNIVDNNIFVECDPSVHIDARGLTWAKEYAAPGGEWFMYKKLNDVQYNSPRYSDRYPKLATLLEEKPDYPLGNIVRHNISVDSEWRQLQNVEEEWVDFDENWVDQDPQFINREKMNFQLKKNSPVYEKGFQKIPFDEIGIYYRSKFKLF